ncbi:Sialidase precursor [Limihaloglobus sulfuriphilus]|uniref:exo-alpha-sialidase n=1 Tax=Limihaloglobus sulfuriphilus TaxID=1851148 RepID=A0A1Q2ME04_9BACT|nr:sialidase family protein [Limihaloglobus sulfuriphilus]AQQ70492.1 Sialidase precursor [Limihaloglobus sulfuriphilus]
MSKKLIFIVNILLLFSVSCSGMGKSAYVLKDSNPNEPAQLDLFVSGRENTANYRIPAILTTPSGAVVAVCDARKDRPGDPPNNIDCVIKRSLDNGRTWSDVKTIADYPGMRAAGDPTLFYDRLTNTMWVAYVYANEGVGLARGKNEPGYGDDTFHIRLQQSKDDGVTWSSPLDITRQIKPEELIASWTAPGVGVQLKRGEKAGRLIFCFSVMNADKRQDSYVAYSDDSGNTWQSSRAGVGTNESQVVELNDGRLMIVLRTNTVTGIREIAYSDNGGENWQPQFESDVLIDPRCQASILRYSSTKDGDERDLILYSNPAHASKRRNLTIRASFDEGKTWPVAKTINQDYSGYSCLTRLPDDSIGVLYERNTSQDGEKKHTLTFARFSLDWLINDSSEK